MAFETAWRFLATRGAVRDCKRRIIQRASLHRPVFGLLEMMPPGSRRPRCALSRQRQCQHPHRRWHPPLHRPWSYPHTDPCQSCPGLKVRHSSRSPTRLPPWRYRGLPSIERIHAGGCPSFMWDQASGSESRHCTAISRRGRPLAASMPAAGRTDRWCHDRAGSRSPRTAHIDPSELEAMIRRGAKLRQSWACPSAPLERTWLSALSSVRRCRRASGWCWTLPARSCGSGLLTCAGGYHTTTTGDAMYPAVPPPTMARTANAAEKAMSGVPAEISTGAGRMVKHGLEAGGREGAQQTSKAGARPIGDAGGWPINRPERQSFQARLQPRSQGRVRWRCRHRVPL